LQNFRTHELYVLMSKVWLKFCHPPSPFPTGEAFLYISPHFANGQFSKACVCVKYDSLQFEKERELAARQLEDLKNAVSAYVRMLGSGFMQLIVKCTGVLFGCVISHPLGGAGEGGVAEGGTGVERIG
jgi:hypothetical protein